MTSRSANHQKTLLNHSLNLAKALIVCGLFGAGFACVPIHELGEQLSFDCLEAQEGEACSNEGLICLFAENEGPDDCHHLRCTDGSWQRDDSACDSRSNCVIPQYSNACEDVDYFQCGFDATCEDGVIRADWHEHLFCGGNGDEILDEDETEEIALYSCTHRCEFGCRADADSIWPSDGRELVDALCAPSL